MKRLALFVAALLLLPVIPAVALAIVDLVPALFVVDFPWVAAEPLAILAGYALWTLVFVFIPPSIKVYVLGHEMTHALWGLLTFSKVGRMRVGENGGSVEVSNPGFFTTLAPYFIPFYLVVLLLLRLLLGLWLDMEPYALHWLFLIGVAYGFHITYTVKSLSERQPDIQVYGRLVSYVAILVINLLLFGYGLVAVTSATMPAYHHRLVARGMQSYEWAGSAIARGCRALPGLRGR